MRTDLPTTLGAIDASITNLHALLRNLYEVDAAVYPDACTFRCDLLCNRSRFKPRITITLPNLDGIKGMSAHSKLRAEVLLAAITEQGVSLSEACTRLARLLIASKACKDAQRWPCFSIKVDALEAHSGFAFAKTGANKQPANPHHLHHHGLLHKMAVAALSITSLSEGPHWVITDTTQTTTLQAPTCEEAVLWVACAVTPRLFNGSASVVAVGKAVPLDTVGIDAALHVQGTKPAFKPLPTNDAALLNDIPF